MSRGTNRIVISIGAIVFCVAVLIGFACLNTVIYAVMAPEPAMEIESLEFEPTLISQVD